MSKPLKVKKVSTTDPIQTTAVNILQTRLEEFYSHWPDPRQIPGTQQLHNLRISGKRLRYSAEQLRELFPDRLALLIDLLKRGQDLLGEIQDCVTQHGVIEIELAQLQQRKPESTEIAALKKLLDAYSQKQSLLFNQFREIWMGLTLPEFRAGLSAMISSNSFECPSDSGAQNQ